MNLLAQVADDRLNFWNGAYGDQGLWIKIVLGAVVGLIGIFLLTKAPPKMRNWIVAGVTFVSGAFYVVFWAWPKPQPPVSDLDIPRGFIEQGGYYLRSAIPRISDISQILTTFILGLGVYSLFRIHVVKLVKQQKDWLFSLVLLTSMISMIGFGYWDYILRLDKENGPKLLDPNNWGIASMGRDLLFDGLLQNMDAAMFSLIAFFIMSAAYRAFRIRSIESTILLGTALIMMISLMGAVVAQSDDLVKQVTNGDPGSFLNNFKFSEIASWLASNVQIPAVNGMQFGVGVGALAMGLRLWLSLEKTGANS